MNDTERLDRIAILEMAHKAISIKLKFYRKKIDRLLELALDDVILSFNEREVLMAQYRLYKYEKLRDVASRRLRLVELDIERLEAMESIKD